MRINVLFLAGSFWIETKYCNYMPRKSITVIFVSWVSCVVS
jgi:hypothetical protein